MKYKGIVFQAGYFLAVCGYGNNVGDGIAVARILFMEGYHAKIFMLDEKERVTEETKQQMQIAKKLVSQYFAK